MCLSETAMATVVAATMSQFLFRGETENVPTYVVGADNDEENGECVRVPAKAVEGVVVGMSECA